MNILNELTQTKSQLIEAASAIGQEKFNTVPFVGSWTAAQVCEHVLKAIGTDVLYAETKPANRQADEKTQAISDVFLDFTVKYQSPDFIVPSDQPQSKHVLVTAMEEVYNKLIEAARTLDLSPICTLFEVPGFGPFTRLEFLWFFNVHTRRHIMQLKNIAVAL